jgi:multidrug efflux pump
MGGQVGAAVPRVRGHAVGGGADLAGDLADHHADDVRLAAASPARHDREAGPHGALVRGGFGWVQRRLRSSLDWALAGALAGAADPGVPDRLNAFLFVKHPQGLLPAAGHRRRSTAACAPTRASPSRPCRTSCAAGRHHPRRSGGGHRGRLHRRLARRRRLHVHEPEAGGARGREGQAVIARLRPQLARVTGVSLFLNPVQDLRMGGRSEQLHLPVHAQERQRADLKRWARGWPTP